MSKSFKTFLKHAGKDLYNQSVNPPVVRASTIIFKSLEDINLAVKNSILAAPFGIEGGECLENNIDNLYYFIKRGLLYLGPTWNYSNSLASSAYDETFRQNKIDSSGLTKFGLDVIKLCNEYKVIIDVSHIGEKSFWDIIKTSKKPIIASHSCVYNLCPHHRNLKDEQIIAIKKNQGCVFVNLYPNLFDPGFENREVDFKIKLKEDLDLINAQYTDPDKRWIYRQNFLQKKLRSIAPNLRKYIDHIEYIIKLVGIDYVGIGSDYDGIECLPSQFSDCTDHMLIATELDSRGYSTRDIEKVMGLNFLRIYKEVKT